MDDVLCNYSEGYNKALTDNPDIKYPQCQYGFYRNLSPKEGALSGIIYLDSQDLFEVYILTAPSVKNPLCYTEKRLWIEDHLGMTMVNKLIISPNKGLNKGDYLIDDHHTGRGQDKFEGTLIQFGQEAFKSWGQVIHYFKVNYDLE